MKEVATVTLEDGKICAILNELEIDKTKYVYLVNVEDRTDYVIRKMIGNELVGLTDEDELKKAMAFLIVKKDN
jgi:hypothetical protein